MDICTVFIEIWEWKTECLEYLQQQVTFELLASSPWYSIHEKYEVHAQSALQVIMKRQKVY